MSKFSIFNLIIPAVFKKPKTRLYPFETREIFEATRGSISIQINKCTFCNLCVKKCPTDALIVDRAARTWEIDRMRCISCNACVDACPKDCLSGNNPYTAPITVKSERSEIFKADPVAEKVAEA